MTDPLPTQLVLGPPGHGVVSYAADVAAALARRDERTRIVAVHDIRHAISRAGEAERVHVHVTDRLLGASLEEAAANLESLAEATALTITVHDVPQASDGPPLSRRVAAYARFFGAAVAVAVNSRHEQQLVSEFLPGVAMPHAIPLGARTVHPRAPGRSSSVGSGMTVLLAGYVYPGKGHSEAIQAAADAAEILRSTGDEVGDVIVRAVGGPSPGHEADIESLTTLAAARGVRFELTGFVDDAEFARRMRDDGIPLAAHQHVSASRSMLDWVEAGRRPLVAASRYAEEMAMLRPDTVTIFEPTELARELVRSWREPERTRLDRTTSLAPTLDDVAAEYAAWWVGMARA